MSQPQIMRVTVSVASVWTQPDSARPMDSPALQTPAAVTDWLKSMTIEDKLELVNGNRLQTQILYGTEVIAVEEKGEWVKVFIPEQRTTKEPAGYPGWVPKRQLTGKKEENASSVWIEVISDKALLTFKDSQKESINLSFLTRLAMIEELTDNVIVDTPHGPGILAKKDIRSEKTTVSSSRTEEKRRGELIVEEGKRFIGLPYLWGGMSSYGYDCSGFAYNMHKSQHILIPRNASEQALQGKRINRGDLEPGDLLFFAHEQGKGRVHHVGIYAGDNKMVHSPNSASCIEIVDLSVYNLRDEYCAARRYWD